MAILRHQKMVAPRTPLPSFAHRLFHSTVLESLNRWTGSLETSEGLNKDLVRFMDLFVKAETISIYSVAGQTIFPFSVVRVDEKGAVSAGKPADEREEALALQAAQENKKILVRGSSVYHFNNNPQKGAYLKGPNEHPNGGRIIIPLHITDEHGARTLLGVLAIHGPDLTLKTSVVFNTHKTMHVAAHLAQPVARIFAGNFDYGTGLPNRQYFENQLLHALKNQVPFSLLFVDLDKFKSINERFTHEGGNQALRAFVDILSKQVRLNLKARRDGDQARTKEFPPDFAGRWGGEEFVVALFGADQANGALVAERLRKAVSANPFAIGSNSVPVTCTIAAVSSETLRALGKLTIPEINELASSANAYGKESGRNITIVRTPIGLVKAQDL